MTKRWCSTSSKREQERAHSIESTAAPDQARYLFIRLYLRKDQWIRLQNIGYENDIEDLQAACEALWQTIIFTPEDENVKPELDLKPGIALNSSSRALPIPVPVPVAAHSPGYIDLTADSDEEDDKPEPRTVEQEEEELEPDLTRLAYGRDDLLQADPSIVMGLLSLEELVTLGKKMKVNPGKGSVGPVRSDVICTTY